MRKFNPFHIPKAEDGPADSEAISHQLEIVKIQRDLALALSKTNDLAEGLRISLEAALRLSGMDCGGIYLFNEDNEDLILRYHTGLSDRFVQRVARYGKDSEHADYVRKNMALYIPYNDLALTVTPAEIHEGIKSIIRLPMADHEQTIGCINLGSHDAVEIPIGVRMSVETVAAQIGNAVSRLKAMAESRKNQQHIQSLMDSAENFMVYRLAGSADDPGKLKVIFVSPSVQDILGIPDPMNFKTWFDNLHPDDVEKIVAANQKAFETFRFDEEFRMFNAKKGEWRWIHAISTGGKDSNSWNRYVNGIMVDVTEKRKTYEKLKIREKELEQSSRNFKEMNTALNVLIENMLQDEAYFQENITANMKHLVFPYIEKMQQSNLNGAQRTLLDTIHSNLTKITAEFSRKLTSSGYGLTATEMKVADLIRKGKKTKEIAELLKVSYKTVESHRERIRKKLGISNTKTNLRSHLLSLK